MNNLDLAQRVKELGNKKVLSQEALAEKTDLSLRTIQRIENNETVPRGDTLKRLAIALDTTPDELIDWKIKEGWGYLTLMSLSALGFLFFPILGIIVPLIFWILKRDKLKHVDGLGKSIINFEITWSILFFSYFIFLFSGLLGSIMKYIDPENTAASILEIYTPIALLYIYNFLTIVVNTVRVSRNKKPRYIPAIRIFR